MYTLYVGPISERNKRMRLSTQSKPGRRPLKPSSNRERSFRINCFLLTGVSQGGDSVSIFHTLRAGGRHFGPEEIASSFLRQLLSIARFLGTNRFPGKIEGRLRPCHLRGLGALCLLSTSVCPERNPTQPRRAFVSRDLGLRVNWVSHVPPCCPF